MNWLAMPTQHWDPRSNIQGGCRSSAQLEPRETLIMGVISGCRPEQQAHPGAHLTPASVRTQLGKGISNSGRTACTPGSQHQHVRHTQRTAGEAGDSVLCGNSFSGNLSENYKVAQQRLQRTGCHPISSWTFYRMGSLKCP